MALSGPFCADVLLRNYIITHETLEHLKLLCYAVNYNKSIRFLVVKG